MMIIAPSIGAPPYFVTASNDGKPATVPPAPDDWRNQPLLGILRASTKFSLLNAGKQIFLAQGKSL
jgi:hypothetical protein